jgi:hypothetical protein
MPTLTAECPKDNVRDDVMGWGVKQPARSESKLTDAVWTDDIRHAHYKVSRALKVNSKKKCVIRWAERVRDQYEPARRAIRVFRWHTRLRPETIAARLFYREADKWKNDTMHWSSVTKMIAHSSYLRIIGLGRMFRQGEIERLILEELQNDPDYWFDALEAITGENPVHPDDDFDTAINAWLEWGRQNRIIGR